MKYSGLNKHIVAILTVGLFNCLFSPVYSQPMNESLSEKKQVHKSIIKNKLDYYTSRFKDIHFIHFDGGDDWKTELVTVLTLLGDNAVALDYEHPEDLQEDLMYVTIERLKYMLENDGFSSTLFRVGDKSTLREANLCVVTLNPDILISDDSTSLRYMLNYSHDIINKIHPTRYIDSQNFIKYSLDHEIAHCLNSFLFGGAPVTFEVLGGEYNQRLRESVADAFAFIMHLKENGKLTGFARNMVHIRALSVFNNDLSHNTLETLLKILSLNINKIQAMNVREVMSFSFHMANETIGRYSDFRNKHALEMQAIKALGYDVSESEEKIKDLEKVITDPLKTERLVEYARYFYMQLFTDTVIDLKSIRLD